MKTHNRLNGFTLIEVLAVILIIGTVLTFVLLKIQQDPTKKSVEFATRLKQLISFTEQQAFFQPTQLGMHFTKNGYEVLYDINDPNSGVEHWRPIQYPSAFRFHPIDPSITFSLSIGHKPVTLTNQNPQIVFWPSGEMTPFLLDVMDQKNKIHIQIKGQANGVVTLIKPRKIS